MQSLIYLLFLSISSCIALDQMHARNEKNAAQPLSIIKENDNEEDTDSDAPEEDGEAIDDLEEWENAQDDAGQPDQQQDIDDEGQQWADQEQEWNDEE